MRYSTRHIVKYSFSSDLQVIHELDEITGTTGMDASPKVVIIQFLRSTKWIIEEIADVQDVEQPTSPSLLSKPSHIIFPLSSSDSSNEATSGDELLRWDIFNDILQDIFCCSLCIKSIRNVSMKLNINLQCLNVFLVG